ncbi:MAG: hypothetical protein HZA52_17910 [Planctomycetes bacterium]|nr:hypothetical protein [Planctomycetota bacterium]
MRPTPWPALLVLAAVTAFCAVLRGSLRDGPAFESLERALADFALAPATWLVARELIGASWAGAAALLAGTCGLHARAAAGGSGSSDAALDAVVLALGLAAMLRARRTDRALDRGVALGLVVCALARGPLGLAVLAPGALGGARERRWARRLAFAAAAALVFALHPAGERAFDRAVLFARAGELGGEAWLAAIGAFGLGIALLGAHDERARAPADELLVATALALLATACDARELASAALTPLAALWAVVGLRWTLGRLELASPSRALRWTIGFVFVCAALLPPLGLALRQVVALR